MHRSSLHCSQLTRKCPPCACCPIAVLFEQASAAAVCTPCLLPAHSSMCPTSLRDRSQSRSATTLEQRAFASYQHAGCSTRGHTCESRADSSSHCPPRLCVCVPVCSCSSSPRFSRCASPPTSASTPTRTSPSRRSRTENYCTTMRHEAMGQRQQLAVQRNAQGECCICPLTAALLFCPL